MLIQGVETCVEIWPASAAEEMEAKALSALNPMSRDARRIQRRFFAHSQDAELDSAGRVRLSKQMIEHAGLSGRCMIAGMGERLEIWAPDEWLSRGRGERQAGAGAHREPRRAAGRDAGWRRLRW